jgi:hypothetical protein
MQSEVTVTLKGEDTTFKKKFLCYNPIQFTEECPFIKAMIEEAKAEYKAIPEDIIIKATCRIQ